MNRIISLLILSLIILITESNAQTVIKMKQENGVYTMPCKVNGLKLRFIFDTGASNVCISLTEALFMLKNGYLNENDMSGSSYSQIANGEIVENTVINLREVDIAGIKLKNIEAVIIHELTAPLLLGNSAIKKLGSIRFGNNELIIGSEAEKNQPSSNSTIKSSTIIEDYCKFIDYDNFYWDTNIGKMEFMQYLPKCAEFGDNEAQFHLGEKLYWDNIFKQDSQDFQLAYQWLKISAENGNVDAQYLLGKVLSMGKGVSKNIDQALYWYQVSAENGNADAQYYLGEVFELGLDLPQDYEKAIYWFRKCRLKVSQAEMHLGNMYFFGKGLNQNYTKAMLCYSKVSLGSFQNIKDTSVINYIKLKAEQGSREAQLMLWKKIWYSDTKQSIVWLKKSAKNGCSKAQTILGELYFTGNELIKNYKQAEYWWLKSANQDDAIAQSHLGCIYSGNSISHSMTYLVNNKSGGVKVPLDYTKAMFWLNKAVLKNNQQAKSVLAEMYYNGSGVSKDLNIAFQLTKDVAKFGNPYYQIQLGYMYLLGEGTNKDMNQALIYFKKAAINGDTQGQNTLANLYYFEKQDFKSAFFWYEKAAQQGNDEAQFTLGKMYSDGKGVLTNKTKAIFWHKKAAMQGNAGSQCILGLMYLRGIGTIANNKDAAFWIKKAYDNGYEEAKEYWVEYELWKY